MKSVIKVPAVFLILALVLAIAACLSQGDFNDTRGVTVEGIVDVAAFPQTGHNGSVVSLAYNYDGTRIVAVSDNTIKIWDTESGRELGILSGHTKEVYQAVFSPDGRRIVSGSDDNTIRIWDAETGHLIRTLEGHAVAVNTVAYSPDGEHILSGSRDHTIKVWDANTGRELLTIGEFGRSGVVLSAAYSPDGNHIVSNSRNNSVAVWDAGSGQRRLTLSGHRGEVISVAYSPDGKQIASASTSDIKVWDAGTGQEIKTSSGSGPIAYSPDGKYIYAASGGLWNLADSNIYISGDSGSGTGVKAVAYSPDGSRILTTSYTSAIIELDAAYDRKELRRFTGYAFSVDTVAYSPNGRFIVSASSHVNAKGDITVWNIAEGRKFLTLSGHTGWVTVLTYSPDGKKIISGSFDGDIREWDAQTGHMLRILGKGVLAVNAVAYSPDGKKIVSELDGYIKIWDAENGKELRSFIGNEYGTSSFSFSPDGKHFVTASYRALSRDDALKLWNTETGKKVLTFNAPSITKVASFSPDGKRIVSADWNTIRIWDAETGRELMELKGHTNFINTVAFSPEGKRIVSGSDDYTIKIWDAQSGQELRSIAGSAGLVATVVYRPDGKQIISGSSDGTIRLWNADTGEEIVRLISFSGADTQIATATRGLTVETETAASSIGGEWLTITPDGYYQASPRGDRYLNVRVGNTVSGIDSYRSVFYNPDVVQARLAGRPDPASKASVTIQQAASFTPPDIALKSDVTTTTIGAANLSVTITDRNRPVKNVKIMVNGRLLGREELSAIQGAPVQPQRASLTVTGNQKTLAFTLPVSLDPGANRVEVVTFNGYAENRRYIDLAWDAPADRRPALPDLWLLAVGVNAYADSRIRSLGFAVADAKSVVDSLRAQEGRRYGKVNSLLVADGEPLAPTLENIRKGLQFLEGAGPRDVVLLFLAGHGVSDNAGTFLFLPGDTRLKDDKTVDPAKAVTGSEIVSVLDAPGNRLVFIDACQSGGVDNDRLVRSLMDTNAFVFTSSRGTELSQERADLGHGVFTYSILSALKGEVAAQAQGNVSVLSLSGFVSTDVPRITNGAQNPSAYSLGFYDFPLAVMK
jgi:WD40 repeat protein